MFREATPVSHIRIRTDRTDYREWFRKTIPPRTDSVECH